jgi:hypothetical protein
VTAHLGADLWQGLGLQTLRGENLHPARHRPPEGAPQRLQTTKLSRRFWSAAARLGLDSSGRLGDEAPAPRFGYAARREIGRKSPRAR